AEPLAGTPPAALGALAPPPPPRSTLVIVVVTIGALAIAAFAGTYFGMRARPSPARAAGSALPAAAVKSDTPPDPTPTIPPKPATEASKPLR
ncbi:MAG TPA: hypothetical protein VM925_18790, partial [Labilithrix sp.]|nr:hypothetical protein [Labilithrix sp.]